MHKTTIPVNRVMGLSIATGRAGYVLFEGPRFLVDWGVADIRGKSLEDRVDRVCALIAWYFPDILVLEDVNAVSCQKGENTRIFVKRVALEAQKRAIDPVYITHARVKQHFASDGVHNKSERAQLIAEQFPELRRVLPAPRKPWTTEDYRIPMFDAAAFALTYLNDGQSMFYKEA